MTIEEIMNYLNSLREFYEYGEKIIPCIGNDWDNMLKTFWDRPYIQTILQRIYFTYSSRIVYPQRKDLFNALRCTPFNDTRVVIIGQDPYINPGQAHGLAFSVLPTYNGSIPPSLQNIFLEIHNECGCQIPNNGCLIPWARQGVLLLNTVLSVEAGKSHSHYNIGWQEITSFILSTLNEKSPHSLVFMLWGRDAQAIGKNIDCTKHLILQAAHPSPLAGGKFFGCNHFIKCNEYLYETAPHAIDWQIPNIDRSKILLQ